MIKKLAGSVSDPTPVLDIAVSEVLFATVTVLV
jgi:hypothetical protein